MSTKQKKQVFSVCFVLAMSGIFFVLQPSDILHAKEKEISINNNAQKTYKRDVTLSINAPVGTTQMKLSNTVSFTDASWELYVPTKKWQVSLGKGVKVVYVRFKDAKGKESDVFYTDMIELDIPDEMTVYMNIDTEKKSIDTRNVLLSIQFSSGIEKMFISNDTNFTDFSSYTPTSEIPWILSSGSGKKTVYIQFLDANGAKKTISDTIEYKEPLGTLSPGTLLKSVNSSLYYLGFDGKIHPFLHSAVFHSWYDDMSTVKINKISKAALKKYTVGKAMCIRGGTWIVKFQNFPQLYAVETGCQLFPIRSEVEAHVLYGPDWKKRIVVLDDIESGMYKTYYRGVQDVENDIVDKDADGVDKETEEFYGSSDSLPDTDGDGLSDIEEIFVWFTEPTIGDTDENGLSDAQDVISTYIAQGGKIDVPEVYMYPSGHVFEDRISHWYYISYADHLIYFLSKKTSDFVYTSNKIIDRFVSLSSPYIFYTHRKGWYVEATSFDFLFPTLITDKNLLYVL